MELNWCSPAVCFRVEIRPLKTDALELFNGEETAFGASEVFTTPRRKTHESADAGGLGLASSNNSRKVGSLAEELEDEANGATTGAGSSDNLSALPLK